MEESPSGAMCYFYLSLAPSSLSPALAFLSSLLVRFPLCHLRELIASEPLA